MSRPSDSNRIRKGPFNKHRTQLNIEMLEERSLPSCNTIGGYVYYDVNNNGLFDSGETPIANSRLELRNSANVVVGSTISNASGYYEFEDDHSSPMVDKTLVKTVNFPSTQTNFSLNGLLDQFETSLGELQSIEIKHDGEITSEIQVENFSQVTASTISGNIAGTLKLTAPGVLDTLNISGSAGTFNAATFDGVTDFQGASGTTFGQRTVTGTNTITLTGAAMDAYKGTGTVTVTEVSNAESNATGNGNLDVRIRSTGLANVTVTYKYKVHDCLQPGNYTILQTEQPGGYFDGKESKDGTVIPNTIGTDQIAVVLADQNLVNNNFGELKTTRISGHVYYDKNNDDARQDNETLISGASITLVSANGTQETTTNADGYYEFLDLVPGTYTIKATQPSTYIDGQDQPGTKGGTVVNDAAVDQIQDITLVAGDHSQNNDFGELKPSSLAGHVYFDANNNGTFDIGETPIANVKVKLEGIDNNGPVNLETTTNANGEYKFSNLLPSTYSITEIQPVGFDDGKDTIGTPGGTVANDNFSDIDLPAEFDGVNNNFGEIKPDMPGGPLPKEVGPLGNLIIVSKTQLTNSGRNGEFLHPTLRGQMAFVVGTLFSLTGQQPDYASVMAGIQKLQSGVSQASFIQQVWNSAAHRANQAAAIYDDVLGRAPTASELAAAITDLSTGKTEQDLKVALFTTAEYGQQHVGQANLAAALYQDILNVTPGTISTQACVQSMGGATLLSDVVHDLLATDAARSDQIDDAYRLTVRRAPSASEIATWLGPIKNGTMTLDELTRKLLASAEFYQLTFNNVH
ncbi:MAG: choice-of-anchor E domain-containing protein [Gemmataceae bacterium]|nr:choice-of-anchor E domain-containing protein [Gemmataceae bacterium]